MKKIIMLALVVLCSVAMARAQLVYRISGNALEKPSYLVGTYHLGSASSVAELAGMKEAMENTEQVCGEVVMSEAMGNADTVRAMHEQMMLPQGNTLHDYLTEEQFGRLNGFMKRIMGADFDNPMMAPMLQMKPATLNAQLTMLLYLSKHMGEFDPTNLMDTYFQTEATKNGKPVIAFETPSYQMNILLGSSLERQAAQLMCLVDNEQWNLESMETLVRAYYAQDTLGISKAMDAKLSDACDATPEEKETLETRRNANWMARMPGIMAQKSTLFAVGMAHLLGPKGLIGMLREQGYKVEGIM